MIWKNLFQKRDTKKAEKLQLKQLQKKTTVAFLDICHPLKSPCGIKRCAKRVSMRTGLLINDEPLIKLGHRLLCLFFSAYDFEVFYRDLDPPVRDPDPLDDLRQFEENEISETLLTLAALARACDDEYGLLGTSGNAFPNGVGALTTDKGVEPLTLREACNKIVHAKSLAYDLAKGCENPIWGKWYKDQGHTVTGDFKAPAIIIKGTRQNGTDWEARLEIVPFVYGVSLENISTWKIA